MRSADVTQSEIFSYRTLEQRIPRRTRCVSLRVLVDGILATCMLTSKRCTRRWGRPSIPPERLLRASLIQALYSIRSERQLVQHIDYNLLYRWFVGTDMDDKVWDHSSFTKNRDRLLNETVARAFFGKVLGLARWHGLVSSEHFSVDGTLIEAWASMKSFKAKDGSGKPPEDGGRNPTVDFKGEERKNDTHASTTDPEARLFKKSKGDKSRLCYMGHALMENRNGLVVDVETTQSTGKAEREAAKVMVELAQGGATLGADKNYDTAGFVKAMRQRKA
jgi:transposase